MRVSLACSLFLFVTGIEANAQLDPGVVTEANSLVLIARVNRLAPWAGHRIRGDGDNERYKIRPQILKHGSGLQDSLRPIFDPDCPSCFEASSDHHGLQPTPDPSMNFPQLTPGETSGVRPIDTGCPPCDFELRNSDSGWEDEPEFRY